MRRNTTPTDWKVCHDGIHLATKIYLTCCNEFAPGYKSSQNSNTTVVILAQCRNSSVPCSSDVGDAQYQEIKMNDIFTEKLISLRELALFAFALLLLAAAPAKNYVQDTGQQPVNVNVPTDQEAIVEVKSA